MFTAAMIIMCTVFVSCKEQTVQEAGGSTMYTIKIDSDTEGAVFGPAQFQIGNAYMSEKNYAEAVRAYSTAIRNGYKSRDIYINRGNAYMALGMYSGVLSDANAALDLNSNDVAALRLRGQAYLQSGNYREAAADLSRPIELSQDNKDDRINRGLAYAGMSDFSAAINDFDKAVSLDPQYDGAYYWRAHINRTYKQDYLKALDDYTKAIFLSGKYISDAYNGRGLTFYKLNNFTDAIADFTFLLETKPDYWVAYYNRGLCYTGIMQYRRAVDDFNRYLELDINNKYGQVQSADYLASYYKRFIEGYIR